MAGNVNPQGILSHLSLGGNTRSLRKAEFLHLASSRTEYGEYGIFGFCRLLFESFSQKHSVILLLIVLDIFFISFIDTVFRILL